MKTYFAHRREMRALRSYAKTMQPPTYEVLCHRHDDPDAEEVHSIARRNNGCLYFYDHPDIKLERVLHAMGDRTCGCIDFLTRWIFAVAGGISIDHIDPDPWKMNAAINRIREETSYRRLFREHAAFDQDKHGFSFDTLNVPSLFRRANIAGAMINAAFDKFVYDYEPSTRVAFKGYSHAVLIEESLPIAGFVRKSSAYHHMQGLGSGDSTVIRVSEKWPLWCKRLGFCVVNDHLVLAPAPTPLGKFAWDNEWRLILFRNMKDSFEPWLAIINNSSSNPGVRFVRRVTKYATNYR